MDIQNVMFSDDDEEYENIRSRLYEGNNLTENRNSREISMFGMSAIIKNHEKSIRRDVILHTFDIPSLQPYSEGFYERKGEILKKKQLANNFAFFGMRQLNMNVEKPEFSPDKMKSERESLLKRLESKESEIPRSSQRKRGSESPEGNSKKKMKLKIIPESSSEDEYIDNRKSEEVQKTLNESSQKSLRKRRRRIQ